MLDTGSADVAFIFSTDANLVTDKYQVLDDDKKLFPPYNITFMISQDRLEELGPDAQKVVEQVQEPLTEEVMQELNSRVDLDKKKPEDVAAQYLRRGASSSSQHAAEAEDKGPRRQPGPFSFCAMPLRR